MRDYIAIHTEIIDGLLELSSVTNHSGMVGWLRSTDFKPEYIYGEITGYFLSFCSDICTCFQEERKRLIPVMKSHIKWLEKAVQEGYATRYMLNGKTDWRNAAVFLFDIAMILRGLSDASNYVDSRDTLKKYWDILNRFFDTEGGKLRPYLPVSGERLPDKWSTRFDVHFMKIIADVWGVCRASNDSAVLELLTKEIARLDTFEDDTLLKSDSHPLMYYMEGTLLMCSRGVLGRKEETVSRTTRVFKKIRDIGKDGLLMDTLFYGTYLRSDVLAQYVRIGSLLRMHGQLDQEDMEYIRHVLDYVLDHFMEDGKVCFFEKGRFDNFYNAWCAMFLCQAISFYQIAASARQFSDADANHNCSRLF